MKRDSLLFQGHTGGRTVRSHEGRVIAAASNQRWSSQGLENGYRNGDVVWIAFAIDIHDCMVSAWVSATGEVISQMVSDLMLTFVEVCFGGLEARFSGLRATHSVQ